MVPASLTGHKPSNVLLAPAVRIAEFNPLNPFFWYILSL